MGVKRLRNGTDDATGHSFSQNMILFSRPNLLGSFLAAQMSLTWLAKFYFSRTGYLKSFGYTFVRLLHLVEKSDHIIFLT